VFHYKESFIGDYLHMPAHNIATHTCQLAPSLTFIPPHSAQARPRTRAAAFSSVSDTFPYSLIYTNPPLPVYLPSPLHIPGWTALLSQHPDRLFVDTLLHIIQYGARIGYCGPRQSIISPNLTSATADPSTLSLDIARELSHHRIMQVPAPNTTAPDTTAPDTPFICSPLGLVPKGSGGWRRIHHLSYTRGSSVNDHIPAEWAALEYATVDQAIALIAKQGSGATLVKRDLQDAFRHIPIAPQDLWLLGFCWEGTYWVDCFLPFGLRTAPYIFDLFAKALHWILDSQASPEFQTIHYLDDFLGVGPAGVGPASAASEFSRQFEYICNYLGLRIKESKSITGTIADFGGIELDTLAMEARLPPAKLQKATELVEHALKKGKLSLPELQCLIGFLSFCCKVVPLGRSFLRRLYDATSNYPRSETSNYPRSETGITKQRRRLTADMKADLRWWQRFLPSWNGIAIIHPARETLPLWTDASGNEGLGGYYLPTDTAPLKELTWSSAFSKPHPRHHRHKHINYKEMLAILTAFRLWLPKFSSKHIAIHTDNTAVYHGLNKRSIRGPAMEPLREITLLAALHDITFFAHWIPTSENILADLLSRRQFAKIADLCPLLAQNLQPTQPSSTTHLKTGTPMLASLGLQPAISGGASAPIHGAPTQLPATATEPSPPSPASTHLSL
jgi:hypothetical protein